MMKAPPYVQTVQSFVVNGDDVYVVGADAVTRFKRDLSADAEWAFTSDRPLEGIAADGQWVYFGVSTLAGEIRRCPLTGCAGDAELLASGQPWPSTLTRDAHTLYWINFSSELRGARPSSVAALPRLVAFESRHRRSQRFSSHAPRQLAPSLLDRGTEQRPFQNRDPCQVNGAIPTIARSRDHLPAVLLVASAIGCGSRVNLGGPSSPPPGTDLDSGTPTTLYQFEGDCGDVSVDDEYIYFSTRQANTPSVYRCRKANCAATIIRIAGRFCSQCFGVRISLAGDRLVLIEGESIGSTRVSRLETCTKPECQDRRLLFDNFPAAEYFAVDSQRVLWSADSDRTIYECRLPACAGGPLVFATMSTARSQLDVNSEWAYWIGPRGRVVRRRKDGSSATEALDLGAVLSLADGDAGAPTTFASEIAVDDSWLALPSERDGGATGCNLNEICTIMRWPIDVLGGPREIIFWSNADIGHQGNSLRIFDGELFFASDQTYSCEVTACMSTLRPFGSLDPRGGIASDSDYIYMCMSPTTPGVSGALQRIARLRVQR
jgi:hypothetical protein